MAHLLGFPILETLPGWPEVYSPSVLDLLVLIVAIPTVIAAVITLPIMGPVWFRRARPGSELESR